MYVVIVIMFLFICISICDGVSFFWFFGGGGGGRGVLRSVKLSGTILQNLLFMIVLLFTVYYFIN